MLPSINNVHPKILPSVNAYTCTDTRTYIHTRTRSSFVRKPPSRRVLHPPRLFPSRTLFHSVSLSPFSQSTRKNFKNIFHAQLHAFAIETTTPLKNQTTADRIFGYNEQFFLSGMHSRGQGSNEKSMCNEFMCNVQLRIVCNCIYISTMQFVS